MNRFSFAIKRKHNRFASPLAGMIYDNKKFQQSCYFRRFDSHDDISQTDGLANTTKSTPYSLQKVHSHKQREHNPEMKSQVLIRSNKIFELSKRLSNPSKPRCTKNKWNSCQNIHDVSGGYARRTMNSAIRFDHQISQEEHKRFKFPEIRVFVLDTLGNGREPPKWVKIDLKRYFEAFFKGTLMGSITQQLSDLVERNINAAVEGQSEEPREENNNKQCFGIVTKRALLEKLQQFEKWNRREELFALLREYCIPKKQLRQIFLKDVLNLLSLQVYQEFGLNRSKEYSLLTENGTSVKDFIDLKFSTKRLYFAQKSKARELFYSNQDVSKYRSIFSNKNDFRQTLKQNFREHILNGSSDQGQQTSFITHQESVEELRHNVSRAQRIINFKKDKSSFGRTRLMQYLNKQKKEKKSIEHSPSEKKSLPKREASKIDNQKRHYSAVDQKITLQFRKLKRSNDYQNSDFKNDQSCKNKIQLGILAKESIYFKTKNSEQRAKILTHLQFIEEGESLEDYQCKTITEDQYRTMRKIINCMGDKKQIVGFVDRYLGYDQYGELSKEGLKQFLSFVLRGAGKTEQVILKTIWGWLEKNGVITNDIIRRVNMQLMYERNKIVYYFLISLIFGTGETSALQLAQGILI